MMTESEVRAACERYNQNPSADAVAELRRCVGDLAVLFLAPDGKALDVAKTGQAWSYCTLTKAKRAPGGKTTAEVLQSTVGTLPASPYDGRPLFMGVTPEGVDYNPVSEERRRWISYGRLAGQLTCSEQEAVDEALVPSPRMQRIGAALAALEAKAVKSAEESRLLLDVGLRMQWTPQDGAPEPVKPVAVLLGEQPSSRAELRSVLARGLRTPSDLDAFTLDYFPGIHRRFSAGMDRMQRENLLLTLASEAELVDALRAAKVLR